MKRIYKRKQYVVWKSDDCGYIVQNISMDGFSHTHLNSKNTAIKIIDLSINKKIPHNLSRYLLESLYRVNDDEEYCRKIKELIKNKRKKDMYYNSNKGIRK